MGIVHAFLVLFLIPSAVPERQPPDRIFVVAVVVVVFFGGGVEDDVAFKRKLNEKWPKRTTNESKAQTVVVG